MPAAARIRGSERPGGRLSCGSRPGHRERLLAHPAAVDDDDDAEGALRPPLRRTGREDGALRTLAHQPLVAAEDPSARIDPFDFDVLIGRRPADSDGEKYR